MAIMKNIILKDNFDDDKQFTNAYIRVNSLSGNKKEVRVSIGIYREENGQNICNQQLVFTPDLNAINFIAQAYEAMKKDQRFAGATDC
jgi:hypothetical protein